MSRDKRVKSCSTSKILAYEFNHEKGRPRPGTVIDYHSNDIPVKVQ